MMIITKGARVKRFLHHHVPAWTRFEKVFFEEPAWGNIPTEDIPFLSFG